MLKTLFLPLFAVLTLSACGEKSTPAPIAAKAPRPVKVLRLSDANTSDEAVYSGEVRARHETLLAFRVGGKLVERRAEVGDRVEKGKLLARLDEADLAAALRQAQANHDLAWAELRRARELRQKNFISQAALEAKEAAAETATAQVVLARNQLAYTRLVSDAAGVIAAVLAESGQILSAGQPVFRLALDGEREVAIAIPESQIARITPGQRATVTLWDGKSYVGVLRELAPIAEPGSRTFAARVSVSGADAALRLGMTARVRFATAAEPHLIVPLAAILQKGNRPAVWRLAPDQTVHLTEIEIARYTDQGAVVAKGLSPTDTIVAAGAFLLSEGETVRPLP